MNWLLNGVCEGDIMKRLILTTITALSLAATATGVGVGAQSAAAAPPPLEYVTLGDSYSAGNGTGTYDETICWRSPDNYGAQVAQAVGAQHTTAACAGGVVADILNPRKLGAPTTKTATYRLPGTSPNSEKHWLRLAKDDALCGVPAQPDWYYDYTLRSSNRDGEDVTATVSCQLTAAPQIDAVTQKTDAVFLTIGGNDIGFGLITAHCLLARNATNCSGALVAAEAKLPRLQEDISAALKAVHDRSKGNAEIYLLGYPHLINTASYTIPEGAPTYDAGAALYRLQLDGDRAQAQAMVELDATTTGKGGFTFVDVKPAWGGLTHGLDPHAVPNQTNSWLVPIGAPGRQPSEWVHPTIQGWNADADALRAALK